MVTHASPVNRLLDELSAEEATRILPEMERFHLSAREVLVQQGDVIDYLYFPTEGMISLVTILGDRPAVETATIGREGVAGLHVYLGVAKAESRYMVQVEGEAWRIPSERFLEIIGDNAGFGVSLRAYTAARLSAASRLAACNLMHPLDKRCARWLLTVDDHLADHNSFRLTHEYLVMMLGVRRAGVTIALGLFQTKGIITSRRGVITLLDRVLLEAEACECDAVIRQYYNPLPAAS